jgi:hypothetical protein
VLTLPRDDAAGPDRAPARGDTARDGAGPDPDVRLRARRRAGREGTASDPAVNAVKAKAKASASKAKTKATKTKVKKAAAADEQSYTQHMLVLRDQLSRRLLLYPCTASDSAAACNGIEAWIKEHGLPTALYSDTASHFVSSLIQQLQDVFTTEHLFAVPYSPWTNGAVKRAGGIALKLLRSACSERRLESHLWYLALGVVQLAKRTARNSRCSGAGHPSRSGTARDRE